MVIEFNYVLPFQGNVAYGKNASQSGNNKNVASRAIDGDIDPVLSNGKCAHPYRSDGNRAWWMVDLGDTYDITNVTLFTRNTAFG